MVDEVHLLLIDLAAIAVLDNAVPLNVLITVVCIFLLPIFKASATWNLSLILLYRVIDYAVMVTGLPSSASWQDLKVWWRSKVISYCFCLIILNFTFMFRIICGELVMSVSLMCIVTLEVSFDTFWCYRFITQWDDLLDSMTVIQTVSYHILEGMAIDACI